MKIGERVTVSRRERVIESEVTYSDKEKSCGYAIVDPEINESGTILNYKSGWIFNWWIVALDNGRIVKVLA